MKKKLFHIIATPREEMSRSLEVAHAFLEEFRARAPNWVFDELNLAKETLPPLSKRRVDGKYVLLEGKNLFGETKELWNEILAHIERIKTADLILITTPMWNFSIPYMLKHYIDLIVQPKYLFRYREDGTTEGLLKGKKMVVAASRGGDYPTGSKFDFQETYLRTIFKFVGITDFSMVIAQPMDMGRELAKEKLEEAKAAARELAGAIDA